jgi:hypothetical protein
MPVHMQVRDWVEYHRRLGGAKMRAAVRKGMARAGKEAVRELQRRTAEIPIWDLGRMHAGWKAQQKNWNTVLVYNRARHTVFVERGRRPGARPPPVDAILPWVRRHIQLDGQTRSRRGSDPYRAVAFLIARAIGRRGIAPRPVLTDQDFVQDVLVPIFLDRVAEELDEALERP